MLTNVLDLLRADGSIVVNKRLAHEIGLQEAVIYSELVSLYKYWTNRGELTDGEWFYCTFPNLEKNTTIKERTARTIVNKLEKQGLIDTKKMGLPAKKYYRITDKILEVLGLVSNKDGKNYRTDNGGDSEGENGDKARHNQHGKNCRTSSENIAEQGRQELPPNNTRTNNTKSNNTDLEKIVNKESHKSFLINLCNEHYAEFSVGRWSKKQWNALVNKFVDEIIEEDREIQYPKAYIIESLQTMAYKYDLRHGRIEHRLPSNPNAKVPFYNWLDERDEDELPY
jgi:DNA-binding PadR family transcriptional regulator